VETATEYLVQVIFPGTVSLADLRWELTGDVLEVEYAAPGWYYYENFLVPATSAPKVSVRDSVFEVRFPKLPRRAPAETPAAPTEPDPAASSTPLLSPAGSGGS
jgi:hypothetical protein